MTVLRNTQEPLAEAAAPLPSPEAPSLHPDLQSLVDWVLDDPRRSRQISAAVDPLEVAARLETLGVSAQVARTRFEFPDVFSAGEALYKAIPRVDPDLTEARTLAPGGGTDLMDGGSGTMHLSGATPEMRAKRDVVYHTLLKRMAPDHKFSTQAKLVSEVGR